MADAEGEVEAPAAAETETLTTAAESQPADGTAPATGMDFEDCTLDLRGRPVLTMCVGARREEIGPSGCSASENRRSAFQMLCCGR